MSTVTLASMVAILGGWLLLKFITFFNVKRSEMETRIKRAAKRAGVRCEFFELTRHRGVRVGATKTTIPRHVEIPDWLAETRDNRQAVGGRAREGVVAISEYTATAQRVEGGWWMVQCDQYPGALSQVRRLD
jgi:hypothetical protein